MKKIIVTLTCVMLTACASYRTEIMVYNDLNHYVPNCNQPEQQLVFLNQQLRNAQDQQTRAVAQSLIKYIKDWCPKSELVRDQGCVAVREETKSGYSQSMVCRLGPHKRTVINRWETDIDN